MSFSGGVYTLPGPALVTGEVVSATENNTFRNDVATAFNLTFLRNGTSTATANLPMGGYKLTGLGVATTNGDALSYGNAAVVSNLTNTALTSGRVNYNGVGGILTDSANLTFNGTTLTATGFSGPLSGNVTGDVTGNVSGNAGTVTNGVYTTGDQTIGGNKTFSSNPILSSGTANGISYLNGSKVVTTGSALTFDGTNFATTGAVTAGTYNRVSNGTIDVRMEISAGNAYIGTATNHSAIFETNSTERMRIDTAGNVVLKTGSLQEVKTAVAASAIDLSTGNYFSKTISGTTTFTVSNVPTTGTAICIILDLTNGGSATVNWWSGMKWASGSAPTLTSSGRDTLAFFTYDGGTTWNGFVLGKAMA